jgi:hypothetical protein
MSRPIYGRVYEVRTSSQPPDSHAYVGKVVAPTTVEMRIRGTSASAHMSPSSIAKDPWKADILPGRDGYRVLEVVRMTGDPAEDDRALRRAEAFWIDRLATLYNDVRPVRPATALRPPPIPVRTSRPAPARLTARERNAMVYRRRARRRLSMVLAMATLFTYLAARVMIAMALPWPAAPWIVSPVVGIAAAWYLFWRAHRTWRRLAR